MSRADLSSMLTVGSYFYEITVDSKVIAIEESKFNANVIVATRRSADGLSKHHVEAALDAEQRIQTVALSYSSSLFTRPQRNSGSARPFSRSRRGRVPHLPRLGHRPYTLARSDPMDWTRGGH
jgi:hypothetical protein